MRILIISQHPKPSGVDYHRLVIPHGNIGKNNPSVEVSNINEIDSAEDSFLQQFDLIVANRFISKMGDQFGLIMRLKVLGVPYVLDLDDDFRIPEWHVLHAASKMQGHAAKIIESINGAACVTVTHELLQRTILNETRQKKVYIVPNGIEPEGQFDVKKCHFTDKVNFGWSGSITHFDDVLELYEALYSLYSDDSYEHKFRMVYGGYENTDNTSKAIAGVLSCKGKAKDFQFTTFPATNPFSYANFYDYINVALIPLRNNRFNNMKSNLKLLEAGFKKKAVIVSDVYPYSPDIMYGWNCLTVKHKNDWYKQMVKLIKDPARIDELSLRLYEYVQDYHMDKVAQTRYEIYQSIL
jgi:processive 1,2-diacylglycerol beta-glucosyltransferase